MEKEICVKCNEVGNRLEMAECSEGHYVHDECYDSSTGRCSECKLSLLEQLEISPAKKLIDHHMNMIRDNASLSIQKPFSNK